MIRVILISSVSPSQASAGQVVLYRHLVDEPEIDLQVCKIEPSKGTLREIIRRVLGRLGQTRLHPLCQDVMALWRGGWIDRELPPPDKSELPTVVMTVAHEEACHAAMRYAEHYQLPLVTIFHDWWPDLPKMHAPFRSILEKSFRQLYKNSSLILCVSPGMKNALGAHQNSKVLLPIPDDSTHKTSYSADDIKRPFRLSYAGNLTDYGPMLMGALELLKDHPDIRLEVRGNSAGWPVDFAKEMTRLGLLHPFAPRSELTSWLESADAFLITQTFDKQDERLMRTNFPSKLPEFAQFHKPLVMWGQEYASGPSWAKETGIGMVVDQKDPQQLVLALEQLCENLDKQKNLAEASKAAALSYFKPSRIQSDFMRHLRDLVE